MEIQERMSVQAPPERVWDLVSDPQNAPLFNQMVQEITDLQQRPDGVGTSWKAITQMGGRMEIANEIVEWEPPQRLSIRMDGPASGTLSFTLTPQGDGSTTVEQTATSNLPAFTAPLIKPMLEQSIKQSMQKIKERVEAQ